MSSGRKVISTKKVMIIINKGSNIAFRVFLNKQEKLNAML